MNNINLATARRLFDEANKWETGEHTYLPRESEIRKIAEQAYGVSTISTMNKVCMEIFRVVAADVIRNRDIIERALVYYIDIDTDANKALRFNEHIDEARVLLEEMRKV